MANQLVSKGEKMDVLMIFFVGIGLLVAFGFFLLFRMFFLWYWKVDQIVELLENIDDNTRNPSKKKIPKKKFEGLITPRKPKEDE